MARLAAALAVAAFVVVAVRTAVLAVPFMNPDNLAYLAWGEELRAGGLPTAENALTTPHPVPILLMAVVGGIVSPLATWAALAICRAGAVVVGAALVAWRAAGSPAWRARCWRWRWPVRIWSAGPAARHRLAGGGRHRPGARGAAGAPAHAARAPGASPGSCGPRPGCCRRCSCSPATAGACAAAVAWGVAAPGLWVLFDGLLLDDPLLAFHRTDALGGHRRTRPRPGRLVGLRDRRGRPRHRGRAVRGLAAVGGRRAAGLVLAAVPVALVAEVAVGYPVRERFALLLVPAVAGGRGSLVRLPGPVLVPVDGGARGAGARPRHGTTSPTAVCR